jgi:GNAT superfamily N-acetyltransferase
MGDSVIIRKVTSGSDFREFLALPWKIYRNDPHWVPPLESEVRSKMDRKKNPFYEHAEREIFLACQGREVVGRVVAILDRNHNSFHQEKVVFFGLYESVNNAEVARALLEAVADWGRERGMTELRGPVNISLNDECAFLLEGFDSPAVIMMPYNPRYYLDLMDACGLVKAKDLYASLIANDHDTTQKVRGIIAGIRKNTTVTCRSFNMKKWAEDAEKVKFVYNHAWEKNWGFVPWTEKEIEHTVHRMLQQADPSIVILAEDKGQPVGFAFGFPNYNEVLIHLQGRLTPLALVKFLYYKRKIRGMRALVFGILKEYRQSGVSYLLYDALERNGQAHGYEWCESSWTLEDNEAINRFNASIGGKVYKKYRIYSKPLG